MKIFNSDNIDMKAKDIRPRERLVAPHTPSKRSKRVLPFLGQ